MAISDPSLNMHKYRHLLKSESIQPPIVINGNNSLF
jgi:hypothetical protein